MIMTNYSIKKKFLAVSLIFGALSAWPMYQVFAPRIQKKIMVLNSQPTLEQIQKTVTEISQAVSNVADTVAQELNAEHDRLLAELQKEFPMQEEWTEMLKEIAQLKAEDTLSCDNPIIKNADNEHEIVKRVRELLAEYFINPEVVQIHATHDPASKSFISAGQGYGAGKVIHELKINIANFSKRSQAIQEAIMRHEIMHLLHYDSLEYSFIISLLEENGIEPQTYKNNPVFKAYCKHKELRADLIAASSDLTIATAFQKDFERALTTSPEDYAQLFTTHPSKKQRHEAMNILMSYLDAEKQQTRSA